MSYLFIYIFTFSVVCLFLVNQKTDSKLTASVIKNVKMQGQQVVSLSFYNIEQFNIRDIKHVRSRHVYQNLQKPEYIFTFVLAVCNYTVV